MSLSSSSMRHRLTVAIALGSAGLMLLLSLGIFGFIYITEERSADRLLAAASQKIRSGLDDGENHFDLKDVLAENSDLVKIDDLAILLIDAKGAVVQKSQSVAPAWPRNGDDGWRVTLLSAGTHTIVIGFPWYKVERRLHYEAGTLLVLSLSVVLFSSAGAWWLVGSTLTPIGRLTQQARNASTENLNLRLVPSSRDIEVVELVQTLNSMLERVSQTVAAKGRFHAAASHELRTPLQILSGHLEVALSRERTGPEYRETVEEAYRQALHLISLTRDLLLLSQLDAEFNRPVCEPVDIADLCQRLVSRFQPLIEIRHLRVNSDLSASAELLAPPTHAEMLLRNLIENAAKYATPDTVIRLSLTDTPMGISFRIFNECSGAQRIPLEHVFEPFYRSDDSRNSETGGSGLGLAICRAIAQVNDWDINLEQKESGLCVSVLLRT